MTCSPERRQNVEEVVQRMPLLNVHGEVRLGVLESQTWRRLQERLADTLDGNNDGLLRAGRRDRAGDKRAREPQRLEPHTDRTLRTGLQPVGGHR